MDNGRAFQLKAIVSDYKTEQNKKNKENKIPFPIFASEGSDL